MTTRTQDDQQMGLDEREVDDEALRQILEDREQAKGAKNEAARKYKTLDELAKGKIADLDVEVGEPVRVGRFRVSRSRTEPRSVSFEAAGGERVHITAKDPDE